MDLLDTTRRRTDQLQLYGSEPPHCSRRTAGSCLVCWICPEPQDDDKKRKRSLKKAGWMRRERWGAKQKRTRGRRVEKDEDEEEEVWMIWLSYFFLCFLFLDSPMTLLVFPAVVIKPQNTPHPPSDWFLPSMHFNQRVWGALTPPTDINYNQNGTGRAQSNSPVSVMCISKTVSVNVSAAATQPIMWQRVCTTPK